LVTSGRVTTLSHAAGEFVLQKVADVLQSAAGCTLMSWRFGGGEFAVILPDTAAEVSHGGRSKGGSGRWGDRTPKRQFGFMLFPYLQPQCPAPVRRIAPAIPDRVPNEIIAAGLPEAAITQLAEEGHAVAERQSRGLVNAGTCHRDRAPCRVAWHRDRHRPRADRSIGAGGTGRLQSRLSARANQDDTRLRRSHLYPRG